MVSPLYHTQILTPIGTMHCCATTEGICLLEFHDRKKLAQTITDLGKALKKEVVAQSNTHSIQLAKELKAYFAGKLTLFKTPFVLIGSDFQKKVWKALLTVPYGTTTTYKAQTNVLGNPKAIRAVANANGKNKLAIIVPCHRIIGSDGNLTGYAGGLDRKRYLLNLERKVAGPKDLFNA